MRLLSALLLLTLLAAAPTLAQDLPAPWHLAAIGAPGEVSAAASYFEGRLRFDVSAEASPDDGDHLAFVYQTVASDTVVVEAEQIGAGCLPAGCAGAIGSGLMIRSSLEPGAPFVRLFRPEGDGFPSVAWREVQDGPVKFRGENTRWSRDFQLARAGSSVRVVANGRFLREIDVDLGPQSVAGVFATRATGLFIAPSVRRASPYGLQGFPDGWVRYASPDASGQISGDGHDPLTATLRSAPDGVVAAYETDAMPRDGVQARLGAATAVPGSDGSGGVGFGLGFTRTATGPFDPAWGLYAVVLRRPDGSVVLRTQRADGTAPTDLALVDDGTDLWRLVTSGQNSGRRAEQFRDGEWVVRGYAPSVGGSALVLAVGAEGEVRDLADVPDGAAFPDGWREGVIGSREAPVGLEYASSADGVDWRVRGGGDLWGRSDRAYAAERRGEGGKDITLSGTIASVEPVDPWAKGGLMIRSGFLSASDSAAYVFAMRRPNGEYYLQLRAAAGAPTASVPLDLPADQAVALTLRYGVASARAELRDGDHLVWSGTVDLGLYPEALLVSTSTDLAGAGITAETRFTGVSVTFSDPGTVACGDVPAAVGVDRAVGYDGDPLSSGRGCWDAAAETLSLRGGGDVWGTSDRFRFVSQPAGGAFELAADVATQATPPNAWSKSGLMVRASLDADAPFVYLLTRPGGLGVYVQMRAEAGAEVESFRLADAAADRLRLWSDGGRVRAQARLADGSLTELFTTTFASTPTTELGFAVTATTGPRTGLLAQAEFSAIDVTIGDASGTAWTDAFVFAKPDPLQTGSVTRLGFSNGLDRFEVVSAGDIWGADDQFQFVYAPLEGDGFMTVQINAFEAVAPWAEPWAKAGSMIRQVVDGSPVDPGAAHASVLSTLDRGIHLFGRETAGGASALLSTDVDTSPEGGHVRLRLERVGDRLFSLVQLPGESGFTPFDERPYAALAGPAVAGFALAATQPDFHAPGQVRATVGLRLTQTAAATAPLWAESFDGMPRATEDAGETAWWGGEFAALTGDGALAIGGTDGPAAWRSEPLAAAAGLDARLLIDTDGAGAGDVLRVLALAGDAEVELATLAGQSGTHTVSADGLRGSAVELRLVAQAPGGAFHVTEAALAPALPPVADAPAAEAPVAALALSAPAPNPARGDAWVELSARDAGAHRVEVVDLLGRRVAAVDAPARAGERVRVALPLGGLGAGVYVVRATAPDGAQASRRLTVVR